MCTRPFLLLPSKGPGDEAKRSHVFFFLEKGGGGGGANFIDLLLKVDDGYFTSVRSESRTIQAPRGDGCRDEQDPGWISHSGRRSEKERSGTMRQCRDRKSEKKKKAESKS